MEKPPVPEFLREWIAAHPDLDDPSLPRDRWGRIVIGIYKKRPKDDRGDPA